MLLLINWWWSCAHLETISWVIKVERYFWPTRSEISQTILSSRTRQLLEEPSITRKHVILFSIINAQLNWTNKVSFERELNISRNIFTNNTANIEGGALKYTSKRPTDILKNSYSENMAQYGKNLASYPVRIRLFNESTLYPYDTLFVLPKEVSNSQISKSLKFGLFDADDQECILINSGSIILIILLKFSIDKLQFRP